MAMIFLLATIAEYQPSTLLKHIRNHELKNDHRVGGRYSGYLANMLGLIPDIDAEYIASQGYNITYPLNPNVKTRKLSRIYGDDIQIFNDILRNNLRTRVFIDLHGNIRNINDIPNDKYWIVVLDQYTP